MFINFWYVAAESKEVETGKPHSVQMLGQKFVVFRDSKGQAHCLRNVCAHRGGSLADGLVVGDCVQCPYHGWQYGGDGSCEHIPTLVKGEKIPARAKVDSYPVMEKYGLIFAFLGDLPEDERPPILECDKWQEEGWASTCQQVVWNLNYQRSIENGMDCFHNDFVHSQAHVAYSARGARTVEPYAWVETEWRSGLRIDIPSVAFNPDTGEITTTEGDLAMVTMGHKGVASFWTYIYPSKELRQKGMNFRQYFYETPIDEYSTRLYVLMCRNFMLHDDEKAIAQNAFIISQDLKAIEPVEPKLPPQRNIREVLLPQDRCIVRYRKLLKQWEARGWRIDSDTVENSKGRVAYAIPCPGRRRSKNWALESVPLVPASQERDQQDVAVA